MEGLEVFIVCFSSVVGRNVTVIGKNVDFGVFCVVFRRGFDDFSLVSGFLVVLLHWGKELDECPLPAQQELADALVAAGADAVVGSHAHRQLGQGWLSAGERRAFVDYGLGNFVFYARGTGATTQSGVLHLTLAGRGGVSAAQWRPAQIRSGLPVPLEGAAADAAVQAKAALRPCTDLSETP